MADNIIAFPSWPARVTGPPPFNPLNPDHQAAWAAIWELGMAEKSRKERPDG